jgi:hypothetical protein
LACNGAVTVGEVIRANDGCGERGNETADRQKNLRCKWSGICAYGELIGVIKGGLF